MKENGVKTQFSQRDLEMMGVVAKPVEPKQVVATQDIQLEEGKGNIIRHMDNLRIFHGGFYKGTYYHRGVGQKRGK